MTTESFGRFVQDQLRDLRGVECRAMFGGYGLYDRDTFFGILFQGRLYFKTDATTATAYLAQGMKPFRPSAKQTLRTYYEVPPGVLDDADQLTDWARTAIACRRDRRPHQKVPGSKVTGNRRPVPFVPGTDLPKDSRHVAHIFGRRVK